MLNQAQIGSDGSLTDRTNPRVRMSDRQMDPLARVIETNGNHTMGNTLPMKKKAQYSAGQTGPTP